MARLNDMYQLLQLVPELEFNLILARFNYPRSISQISPIQLILTHLFPMHFSQPPKNITEPYGFLMFSEGRERMCWERMS